jgi:hypothetical protein
VSEDRICVISRQTAPDPRNLQKLGSKVLIPTVRWDLRALFSSLALNHDDLLLKNDEFVLKMHDAEHERPRFLPRLEELDHRFKGLNELCHLVSRGFDLFVHSQRRRGDGQGMDGKGDVLGRR